MLRDGNLARHDYFRRLKSWIRGQQFRMNGHLRPLNRFRPQGRAGDEFGHVIVGQNVQRVRHDEAEKYKKEKERHDDAVAGGERPPVPLLLWQQTELEFAIELRHPFDSNREPRQGVAWVWSL